MQVGAGDVARGSAAKDWITGPARLIPWAQPSDDQARTIRSAAAAAALQKLELAQSRETSPYFRLPRIARALQVSTSCAEAVEAVVRWTEEREAEALELEV